MEECLGTGPPKKQGKANAPEGNAKDAADGSVKEEQCKEAGPNQVNQMSPTLEYSDKNIRVSVEIVQRKKWYLIGQ